MELHPTPGNEVPKGLVAGELVTPDGTRLRYGLCRRDPGGRGTVCLFEGRGEFIEKYFETIEDLAGRGFAVAILDWRGQGGSERRFANPFRSHVGDYRRYDQDLVTFMTGAVLPDCPPPYYALAHSTGALVLLRTLTARNWFKRVVLSSPLIDLAPLPLPRGLVKVLSRLATWVGLGWMFVPTQPKQPLREEDFPDNKLTSDLARFERTVRTADATPALASGGPTFTWLSATFRAIREMERLPAARLFLAPVLIIAARDDRIVSAEAIRRFARRRPGVAAVIIDRARHELLQERDSVREQFWAAFDTFIDADQSAGLQAGQVSRRARASS